MPNSIPIFSLDNFSDKKEVHYIETQSDTKNIPLHLPYRTDYYGFGIVINGKGTFNINLESYFIQKGSVLSIPPDAIKQWLNRSNDLKTITIFFTKDFFYRNVHLKERLEKLDFFQKHTKHIITLVDEQFIVLANLLGIIKDKLSSNHHFGNEIVANLLNIVFYEYSIFYNRQVINTNTELNRSAQIAFEFKKLVSEHFIKERKVKFYADILFLSSKHLTETIKSETGKTASEWIFESVILEAKILLKDPNLNIAQITDTLNFSDQSTFGKFFKNRTGLSPLAYRQKL